MNHPSNVVLRHARCDMFDTHAKHEGGTGGNFQVWRAGLHLVRWAGLDNVYDYASALAQEFSTLEIELRRFFNYRFDVILGYTTHEYLQELKRMCEATDFPPYKIYELARAYSYLHRRPTDHLSWNEHALMPL